MGENEREIEVRTLTRESTIVSISPNMTIQDLKLLLKKLIFPPASCSTNFHLFLEGVKLSLQSQISDHPTKSGEFIVVIPFTKKDRKHAQKPDEAAMASKLTNQCLSSNLADSAWSDLMQDLSSMQNTSNNENQHDIDLQGVTFDDRNVVSGRSYVTCISETEHRTRSVSSKQEEISDSLRLSILQSLCNNVLDEKNCERLIQILESPNRLADPLFGTCMLREANSEDSGINPCESKSSLCLCPSWLKEIMTIFLLEPLLGNSSTAGGKSQPEGFERRSGPTHEIWISTRHFRP